MHVQSAALAAQAKETFTRDMVTALKAIHMSSQGNLIELDISAGLLDSDELKPYLIFTPQTSAAAVLLTGSGADPFDPYFGMVLSRPAGERRLQGAQTLSGSGQGGTTFRNLPITVS